MTSQSGSIQNFLLYITTILIWGSSWLAIKLQLGYVDPMVSVAYRFLLASGISWFYCLYSGRLMRFGLRDHMLMFLQGTFLFSLNYLLFYISELTLTSGLAGTGLVFWPEITDFETGDENLTAAAIAVLATFLASLGNIASARNQHNGVPVIEANTYGMTYGALLMLAMSFASGKEFTIEMTTSYIGSLLFLSVFASILPF